MNNTTLCKICNKNFSKRCNLRAHIKQFHPGKLEELAPIRQYQNEVFCKACNKSFVKYSNLNKHVKQFHADQLNQLIKPKLCPHKCDICSKQFPHLQHLRNHKKCHEDGTINELGKSCIKCILCKDITDQYFEKKSDLLQHFEKRHDINIIRKKNVFGSFAEFESWKKMEEKNTNEFFANVYGTQKLKNETIKTRYVCHRTGTYKPKGAGIRHLKTQGSKKIGGICPAEICLIMTGEKCEVEYISTHVGHSNDLTHLQPRLQLTELERQSFAAKIPFDAILDEVRESVSDTSRRAVRLFNSSKKKAKNNINLIIDEIDQNDEEVKLIKAVSQTTTTSTTNKSELLKEISEIQEIAHTLTSPEEINLVKTLLAPIKPSLTALRKPTNTKLPNVRHQKTTHNKIIDPQRRLHKTKKT